MGLFEIALWIAAGILIYKSFWSNNNSQYQILYPAVATPPLKFNLEYLSGLYYVWEADTNKFVTQGASIGQIKHNMAKIYNLKPEHFEFDVTEAKIES